jgi:hypothetical protein
MVQGKHYSVPVTSAGSNDILSTIRLVQRKGDHLFFGVLLWHPTRLDQRSIAMVCRAMVKYPHRKQPAMKRDRGGGFNASGLIKVEGARFWRMR